MELTSKKFPYPVLVPDGDDYIDCKFEAEGDWSAKDQTVTVRVQVHLECRSLQDLIDNGQAKIIGHVECPQAAYRRAFEISEGENTFSIPVGDLSGRVYVCPFIVATTDVKDYSSPQFNPDYDGISFFLHAGSILAEGKQLNFIVDVAKDEIAHKDDIFSIIPHELTDEENKNVLRVGLDSNKIVIELPKRAFGHYVTLRKTGADKEFLWSVVALPGLIAALSRMKEEILENDGSFVGLDSYAWCRSLASWIRRLYPEVETNPIGVYENLLITETAQRIIKTPVPDVLQKLTTSGDEDDN